MGLPFLTKPVLFYSVRETHDPNMEFPDYNSWLKKQPFLNVYLSLDHVYFIAKACFTVVYGRLGLWLRDALFLLRWYSILHARQHTGQVQASGKVRALVIISSGRNPNYPNSGQPLGLPFERPLRCTGTSQLGNTMLQDSTGILLLWDNCSS